MARIKRGIIIASTLMLVVVITSACKTPYSQAPAQTVTPVPQSNLFASAQPTTMGDISTFAAQTAIVQLTTSPGVPVASPTIGAGITPQAATATNTPLVSVNPTTSATLAVPNGPSATPIPAGSVPGTYTLQSGEFVYCIARRFNINPDEILALNGIADSQTIYPGLTIKLPQAGSAFPGNRMLRNHPASYTVSGSGESVYSVACAFGDIDPARIAQANNISVGASLNAGQTLNIP